MPKREIQLMPDLNSSGIEKALSILNIIMVIVLPIAIGIEVIFLIWMIFLFLPFSLIFPFIVLFPNIWNIIVLAGSSTILVLYTVRVFPKIRRGDLTRGLAIEVSIYAFLLIVVFYLSFESGAVMGAIAGIMWYIIINK
jgi:hypothetical protein